LGDVDDAGRGMGRKGGFLCVCGRVASPGNAAWIGWFGKAGEEIDAVGCWEGEVENVVEEVEVTISRMRMYVWTVVPMRGWL